MDKRTRLELAKDDLYTLEQMYKKEKTEELKEAIKKAKKEIKSLNKD